MCGSVLGLLVPAPTLCSSIDDHCGHSKSGYKVGCQVCRVGSPRAVKNLEHAGLWRLRGHKEPHGGCKVEPGSCHKLRLLQQHHCISKHGVGKGSIVVVPSELLCSSPVVHLTGGTRVGFLDPGCCLGTVRTLIDLLQVVKAPGLKLNVG